MVEFCKPAKLPIQYAHLALCHHENLLKLLNVATAVLFAGCVGKMAFILWLLLSASAPRVSKQTICPWSKRLPLGISPLLSHDSSTMRQTALHQAVCRAGILGL